MNSWIIYEKFVRLSTVPVDLYMYFGTLTAIIIIENHAPSMCTKRNTHENH